MYGMRERMTNLQYEDKNKKRKKKKRKIKGQKKNDIKLESSGDMKS